MGKDRAPGTWTKVLRKYTFIVKRVIFCTIEYFFLLPSRSYYINWGDMSGPTVGTQEFLSSFEVDHQYDRPGKYGVAVHYCSINPDPYDSPNLCCDRMYSMIHVSLDPNESRFGYDVTSLPSGL